MALGILKTYRKDQNKIKLKNPNSYFHNFKYYFSIFIHIQIYILIKRYILSKKKKLYTCPLSHVSASLPQRANKNFLKGEAWFAFGDSRSEL